MVDNLYITPQIILLLNIIHSINTSTKVLCECKDFNPMQQMHCKELVNCLLHPPSIRAGVTKDPQKVFGPELACILQSISTTNLLLSGKILDLTENSIVNPGYRYSSLTCSP